MSKRQPLSVAIVACNEAENIRRTLASVTWAEEIVLLDSGSTDDTLEIAREFNAVIFQEPWRGYGPGVNSALEHCKQPWILNLDADEVVTPELASEIQLLLSSTSWFRRLHNPSPEPDLRPVDAPRRSVPRSQAASLPQRIRPLRRRHRATCHTEAHRPDRPTSRRHSSLPVPYAATLQGAHAPLRQRQRPVDAAPRQD